MSNITRDSAKLKKKKRKGMFNYLLNAVDKVFYQVYDGEPVRRNRSGSIESILEEEVIFCKNNVCVKVKGETNNSQMKEIAGYMNMKKIYRSDCEYSDLILSWVPNKLLSAGSMEEAEIMLPPAPTEQINPIIEPSKFSSAALETNEDIITIDDESAATDATDGVNLEVAKDFDSPLGNVFGINLIDMKTVKLFYSSLPDHDSGQFVIGSHDSEYKVFHFHNGGLNKLAEIFDSWNGCIVDEDLLPEEVGQKVYYITRKNDSQSESVTDTPVEEGRYKALNMQNWMTFMNSLGQIEDSHNFRKHVFFGGLSHEVRPDAWKFLLYYHPLHSMRKEREQLKEEKTKAYETIHNKRLALAGKNYETFWRNVQFTVDKDVVRTDRSHPYYAGQDNPNIQKMRNILLNYAVFNPTMGYSQGMSDLVAPVLATLHDEVDCFWCFVGLMESSMFATTPRDDSMDRSLGFLRELLRIMTPDFYMHCLCNDEEMNLLFAHRWLVLCFKREFIFHEVLKIWEACWSRYQTDYFHIFICVGIVSIYGGVCMEKKMDAVEILQYFTEMATKFDGSVVLKAARSLLHKFRQLNRIPCTLRGLLSDNGVWDGGILPEVECVSTHTRCCLEHGDEQNVEEKISEDTSEGQTKTIETKCDAITNNQNTMQSPEDGDHRLETKINCSIENETSVVDKQGLEEIVGEENERTVAENAENEQTGKKCVDSERPQTEDICSNSGTGHLNNKLGGNGDSIDDSQVKSDESIKDSQIKSDELTEDSQVKSDELIKDSDVKDDESIENSKVKGDESIEESQVKGEESKDTTDLNEPSSNFDSVPKAESGREQRDESFEGAEIY